MAVCGEGENLLAENSKFEWQRMLHKALIEQDPEKLKERVAEAEAALFLRLQDLAQTHDSSADRVALHDASEASAGSENAWATFSQLEGLAELCRFQQFPSFLN